MQDFAEEIGKTVRFALGSNQRTARLAVLMLIVLIGVITHGLMLWDGS